jgi:hypothetical protein
VFDHDKQHIAAVSRTPGNLDLFLIGLNNHIWSTFWGLHVAEPVIKIHAVAVVGEGGFVEVTGNSFTPNQTVKLGYDIAKRGGPTTRQTGEHTLTSDKMGSFLLRVPVTAGSDISGAQVQATDVASGATATASI